MQKQEKPTQFDLKQIRAIADFQFGKGAGEVLFSEKTMVERSKGTRRIRYIYRNNERICSFRVRDGFLIPSLIGGEILHKNNYGYKVTVNEDAEPFVRDGKTVFSKHVLDLDEDISAKDEVIIINQEGEFLGIGTAKISGKLIREMKSGVAVATRKGIGKKN
jgi:7-cyano-7-deazaguanine tRNA-ribosyltransferase